MCADCLDRHSLSTSAAPADRYRAHLHKIAFTLDETESPANYAAVRVYCRALCAVLCVLCEPKRRRNPGILEAHHSTRSVTGALIEMFNNCRLVTRAAGQRLSARYGTESQTIVWSGWSFLTAFASQKPKFEVNIGEPRLRELSFAELRKCRSTDRGRLMRLFVGRAL